MTIIELKIDPEFRDKIPPLTDAEFEQLKDNILADGEVYEPICVWNGTIVDGHNRWKIIQEHPEIPYRIREMEFADKWEAFEWMYRKQLGRRNLTEEQKAYMVGKMYEARKKSVGAPERNTNNSKVNVDKMSELKARREQQAGTAGQIGKEFGLDGRTVRRAEQFAKGVDKADEVVPGFREQVLSGKLSVAKKDVAAIRKLESDEEVKAAVEEIRKPKPKREKNPNIHPVKETKRISKLTEEDIKRMEFIHRINESQQDIDRGIEYTVDDLVNEITVNGNNYISSLRATLVKRQELFVGYATDQVKDTIDQLIAEIEKLKELIV